MTAEECISKGQLDEAYELLKKQVQADPANPKLRIFLFQILIVMGEWQRGLTQLNVVGEMDTESLPMVQTYRELIRCEVYRESVFKGKIKPLVFGEPAQWIVLLIEALTTAKEENETQVNALRNEAFELAPTASGKLDNDEFEWIADADSRLGPLMEVILNGRYYWVPFSNIKEIKIEEPEDLRDLVWTAAQFMWTNKGEAVGFIPTRYVNTHLEDEAELKLSRKTIWQETNAGVFSGKGQRVLTTNKDDYSLMNIRSISFDVDESESTNKEESE